MTASTTAPMTASPATFMTSPARVPASAPMTAAPSPASSAPSSRALVLWCPDWPVVAAAREAGLPMTGPTAVLRAGRVEVCTAAARAGGVRRGMRRRDAQSRCPTLAILAADPDRDARLFEPVAAIVEDLSPGIEVLRPGLLACRIRGLSGYVGSETSAAERIVDAVEAADVECHIGIADVLEVAVLAARRQTIVPSGGQAAFCGQLPLTELARDPAIAPPEWFSLVEVLRRLGITTARELTRLPAPRVAARFGSDGLALHRLASGSGQRPIARRHVETDIVAEQECDPPLERVDTAAFVARALAGRFHTSLAASGLACTRLAITARTERGAELSRVWRCTRPLTAEATADRLRWQLDGWLTGSGRTTQYAAQYGAQYGAQYDAPSDGATGNGAANGSGRTGRTGSTRRPGSTGRTGSSERTGPGAITVLTLEAVEAVDAGLVQYGLWGSDGGGEHRAGRAFARVQGLLGPESVRGATRSGGRAPADRITVATWGEENIPDRDPAAPWPGTLPSPAPTTGSAAITGSAATIGSAAADSSTAATISATTTVTITDQAGRAIAVTGRGLLTGEPAAVDGRQVLHWAGPWLFDERWWAEPAGDRREQQVRMQMITESGPPMLVESGPDGWYVEAVYD